MQRRKEKILQGYAGEQGIQILRARLVEESLCRLAFGAVNSDSTSSSGARGYVAVDGLVHMHVVVEYPHLGTSLPLRTLKVAEQT
jgi:hypothetical protein